MDHIQVETIFSVKATLLYFGLNNLHDEWTQSLMFHYCSRHVLTIKKDSFRIF